MYLLSLHGQATSFSPGASGLPTECTQGTNSPSSRSTSNTARPIRVISRMLTTTYGLSLTSTPICAMCEPSGPIENGITYIVLPRMQPANRPLSVERICAGSIQLLVGPASFAVSVQMNVRSSTRATSDGSDQARKEFARLAGFSRRSVPARTISSHSRSDSWTEPSHQTTRSGCVKRAIDPTQSISFLCLT